MRRLAALTLLVLAASPLASARSADLPGSESVPSIGPGAASKPAANEPPPAPAAAAPDDPRAADRAAILEASRAFSRAYVAGDSAAVAALYTEDGLLMPPNRDVRGREAVAGFFSTPPDRRPAGHGMDSSELRIVGDVAIDVGRWWLQREEGGPKVGERYLLVWLRQDDGSWKIAYDVWHRQAE